MQVEVNGERREVQAGASVADLLAELGLATRACAVERNERIVPRAEHGSTFLHEGDQLEVVHFVGGG